MATFRTKARAVDLLGRNQIADLPTAITELWKNGYDAYGDYLSASLFKSGYDNCQHDIFILSDDGHGMSKYDLENKWIVLGTDSKKNTRSIVSEEDRFGKALRVPLGEKGIGRLSVTYLGSHMLMITKKNNEPYQMLFMNWKILDNYELYLDEINIPIESFDFPEDIPFTYKKLANQFEKNLCSKSWENFPEDKIAIIKQIRQFSNIPDYIILKIKEHYAKHHHGTMFIIFDPIEELSELEEWGDETDKALREQLENQAVYIRSALAALFNPFDKEKNNERKKIIGDIKNSPSFYIYKEGGEAIDFLTNSDFFTTEEFEECEHWIDGSFDSYGCFNGKIKVYGNEEEYVYIPQRKKQLTKFGNIILKVAFWEGSLSKSTLVQDKWNIYETKAQKFGGLYVYRDGFRVLPYGRTDMDFLEFEYRRSKGAGVYYFSHRKMIGYIGITKEGNPKLIDKSGREGFVSNVAYREMKDILIEFFKHMAKERYGTQSKVRKDILERYKKEKIAENLRKEEAERNALQIKELRKKVKANEKELKKLELKVLDIQGEIDKKINESQIMLVDSRVFASQVQDMSILLNNLKIFPSTSISFAGYDREYDMYFDYEENRKNVLKTVDLTMEKIQTHTYVNTLKDVYKDKFVKLNRIAEEEYENMFLEFNVKIDYIQGNFKEIFNEWVDKWKKLSPWYINIDDLTVEDTQEYLKKIDQLTIEREQIFNEKLGPIIEKLNRYDANDKDSELLSAYKDIEVNLSQQLDNFYELAQVGMAIEIIDHQFNVLYNQMNQSIKNITSLIPESSSLQKNMDIFRSSFQHLESNHKMLMPLYRTTRKTKREISGYNIKDTIENFFNKIMKDNNIDFKTTKNFNNWSCYTYESMITPVYINIINNAVYWVRLVETRKIIIDYNKSKDEVLILNSGPKMSETEIKRCFELFYSKKVSGRGIGLYLAKRNLQAIEFDIYATNDSNYNRLNGACFVICKYDKENC